METLRFGENVTAKKDHTCNFCGEKILKGSIYVFSTHKHEGDLYNWKTHKYCGKLASVMNMYENCDDGVTEDDFTEHVSNFHDDLLIDLLPKGDKKEYSDIIQQLRHVNFKYKLNYVLRHFIKKGKINPEDLKNIHHGRK